MEQDGIQETARDTYDVRYLLRWGGEDRLSLDFILTGDNANLALLQDNQPGADESAGQVDQRVYRATDLDDLRAAVQRKLTQQRNVA